MSIRIVVSAPTRPKYYNLERVKSLRFAARRNYRLYGRIDFRRQIASVKFIGSHAQYDKIDALTVSQF